MTNKVTDEQLEKWIADAKKATQGHGGWFVGESSTVRCVVDDYEIEGATEGITICTRVQDDDAFHIANMCPTNALAVLEELKQYRAAHDAQVEICKMMGQPVFEVRK